MSLYFFLLCFREKKKKPRFANAKKSKKKKKKEQNKEKEKKGRCRPAFCAPAFRNLTAPVAYREDIWW